MPAVPVEQEREEQPLGRGAVQGPLQGAPGGARVAEGFEGRRLEQGRLNLPQVSLAERYGPAISAAVIVVACELLTLAYLRHKFFRTSFARSFVAVAVGGAIIAALSTALGILAAS